MSPSPSELASQPRPQSKDPPDKDPARSRPTIQIRSPTIQHLPKIQPEPQPSPEPPTSPLPVRPPFSPFFTLITDTRTGTIHHPRNIHYLFSDDDPNLLTSACLSALEDNPSNPTQPRSRKQPPTHSSSSSNNTSGSQSSAIKTNLQGEAINDGPEERILVLDLDASGTAITKASSLSSSWQILSTSLAPAPTWAENPSPSDTNVTGSENATPNFMLRIAGTDGGKNGRSIEVGKAGEGGDAFEKLMAEFDEKMKVLKTVVDDGIVDEDEGDGEREKEA